MVVLAVAVISFTALNVHAYFDPSIGRWASRDPLGDASFFNSYSQGKDDNTVDQLQSTALQPVYSFVANNPIFQTDLLGLENAQITVTTAIRPKKWSMQAGVKTIHNIVVSDHGQLVSHSDFVGTTSFTYLSDEGIATFDQGASGDYPDVTAYMGVSAQSFFLQLTPLTIRYEFEIDLNFCSRKGHLSGYNRRYPSYNVRVNGKQIYDFEQVLLVPGLLGISPAEPNVDFKF